jgi:uncharacterized membrane protein
MMESKSYRVESRTRTLLKSISWRLFGTLATFLATLSITKSLDIATAVGAIELCAKIFLFYLHERIWMKINSTI